MTKEKSTDFEKKYWQDSKIINMIPAPEGYELRVKEGKKVTYFKVIAFAIEKFWYCKTGTYIKASRYTDCITPIIFNEEGLLEPLEDERTREDYVLLYKNEECIRNEPKHWDD